MSLTARVYAEELYSSLHGIPLWNPHSPDGEVCIGDVGYIDDEGTFCRLFNITVDRDHPRNKFGVPKDFDVLSIRDHLLKVKRGHLPPGTVLTSSGVSTKEGLLSVSAQNITGGVSLSCNFRCSRERGAVLALPHAAKKAEVDRRSDVFQKYAAKNHAKWCKFASEVYGVTCDPTELILVSGVVKTSAWATTAWSEYSREIGLTLNGNALVGGAGFRWASSVSGSVKCEHHAGPNEDDLARARIQATTDERRNGGQWDARILELPDIKAEFDAYHVRYPEENQSVFIKGYRVKHRHFPWLKKISAHAGYDQLPEGDRDRTWESPTLTRSSTPADNDDSVEYVPERFPFRSFVEDLLDYILEMCPDALLAIACDNDVYKFLKCCQNLTGAAMEMSSYLRLQLYQAKPMVVITDGVGSLFHEDEEEECTTTIQTAMSKEPQPASHRRDDFGTLGPSEVAAQAKAEFPHGTASASEGTLSFSKHDESGTKAYADVYHMDSASDSARSRANDRASLGMASQNDSSNENFTNDDADEYPPFRRTSSHLVLASHDAPAFRNPDKIATQQPQATSVAGICPLVSPQATRVLPLFPSVPSLFPELITCASPEPILTDDDIASKQSISSPPSSPDSSVAESGSLLTHSRAHDAMLHECKVCGKQFNRLKLLAIHVNDHTRVEPFQCDWPGCNQRFNVESDMRGHFRNHSKSPDFDRPWFQSEPSSSPSPTPMVDHPSPSIRPSTSNDHRHQQATYHLEPALLPHYLANPKPPVAPRP